MKRRAYLSTAGGLAIGGLAGCLGGPDPTQGSTSTPGSLEGTLRLATYSSFVDAPSSSPGPWLKRTFEDRHPDVTIEWETPENGINNYILRRQNDAGIDADCYLGLKVPEQVRIARELDDPLFEPVDAGRLPNAEHVGEQYTMTADSRVRPVFTGYQSFVYNGYEVSEPETLDALTQPEYEGELTVQNPQTDNTGLYFLLWTIKVKGEDGYLDYWQRLVDNGVRILETWSDVYGVFLDEEASIIPSFSTDRVFATRSDQDLEKHRVAFPGGHGYVNLSGMGRFADSDQPQLTSAFMDFMLSPEAQAKLAELNVVFPVTENATPPEVFQEHAKVPSDPLMYTAEELRGNLQPWTEDWARQIAG